MAILQQLGINFTIFYQLLIFVFGFSFLALVVFKPYAAIISEREKRTKGATEGAVELKKQTNELASRFEVKARQVSEEIKTIFDTYRAEANKEYEIVVGRAREESQKLIEETRTRVTAEVLEAGKKMKEEVPALSRAITQKMLSK